MTQKYKGHRINKDGTHETIGEVHNRLTMRFNSKVGGAVVMGLTGLAVTFDALVSDQPVMQNLVVHMTEDSFLADQISRMAEIGVSLALVAGAAWASHSATRDATKLLSVEGNMRSLGRDYRPGDRARQNAALLALSHRDIV